MVGVFDPLRTAIRLARSTDANLFDVGSDKSEMIVQSEQTSNSQCDGVEPKLSSLRMDIPEIPQSAALVGSIVLRNV
jgi:hypothetical protein